MTSATMPTNFARAPYEVRPAFEEAHSMFWGRLARAGAWWTGAERVAIAAEARSAWDCSHCAEQKEALSPHAVAGEHSVASNVLTAAAIDAVHRLVTDANRISKPWLESLYERGLTEGQYVEIVGTVVAVVSIDSFCLALGVAPHSLPEPVAGEISCYRPSNLEDDGAFVPMLGTDLAGTPEEDLWGTAMAPNVYRAMSAVPDEVRTLRSLSSAHYLGGPGTDDPEGSALTRQQMELIAGRVSALNECFY